jgi:hypothetical protein
VTPEINISHLQAEKRWGFSARQRYTYGTFGPRVTENDILSRNFIYLTPDRRWYPYLMAWFQTHARQQLNFRYQLGPGITFVAIRRKSHLLKLSATATIERNWYNVPGLAFMKDKEVREYSVARATARVFGSHALSDGIVSLYYELLMQQALDHLENWRVFAECGVSTRITTAFSLRSFFNYEYQQVHVETEKPEDLILNVALSYRLLDRP